MHRDPVCGMPVDPDEATHTSNFVGKTYYFCSYDCKDVFDETPEQYADEQGEPAA